MCENKLHVCTYPTVGFTLRIVNLFVEVSRVGGMCPPPSFGISVNPIWTKGGRLCPPHYYWAPHLVG